MQAKQDIEFVNIAKTVGIVLVAVGHLTVPVNGLLFINSFHMPLFFILSGYLLSCSKYNLQSFAKRKAQTLLIPYLFFAVVSFLFWYFAGQKLIERESGVNPVKYLYGILLAIPSKEYLGFNIPIWFLPSLFCTEMIFFIYQKYIKRYTLIFCVFLFIVGTILKLYAGCRLPYGLDVGLFTILFLYSGYLLRKNNQIITYMQRLKPVLKYAGIIASGLLTYWFALLNGSSGNHVSVYTLQFYNYPVFLCSAFSGIIFTIMLSVSIPSHSLFRFFGRNTIVILGFHLMCFAILKGIQVFIFHISIETANDAYLLNFIYVLLAFAALAPVIYCINRFAPFLLGRKKTYYNS